MKRDFSTVMPTCHFYSPSHLFHCFGALVQGTTQSSTQANAQYHCGRTGSSLKEWGLRIIHYRPKPPTDGWTERWTNEREIPNDKRERRTKENSRTNIRGWTRTFIQ